MLFMGVSFVFCRKPHLGTAPTKKAAANLSVRSGLLAGELIKK
jgi:hypothetical protein